MIKQAPSVGRILAMVVFALSCFGLLLFLWIAFGGAIPLAAKDYQVKANFPEAATLAQEADVRMAGVNIGKVKTKSLNKKAARTTAVLAIDPKYAPLAKDTRAILRQKTLLGETYVELSPGHKSTGTIHDGGTIPNPHIEPTVQLDEIYDAFDKPTRTAFQVWVKELTKATAHGTGQSLNDAFGNLAGFSVDGAKLFRVLDEQGTAVHSLIKNTGVVFGAINEREGALRQLIVNSNNTFAAIASRDQALAQTFAIFPTFLDESKSTLARLQRFAVNTRPLVNDLKQPATDLGPTVRDLGDLSPDLEHLFRSFKPLIKAAKTGLPDFKKVLAGAEPVLEAAHPWFQELNPILSYFNFHQATIACFLSCGGPDLTAHWGGQERLQTQVGIIDGRSFSPNPTRPKWERGNAYMAPNALYRALQMGTIESFDCTPSGGEQKQPDDQIGTPGPLQDKSPPCFVQPPSLYNNRRFVLPGSGQAPLVQPPKGDAGTQPANPNR
jgi:phospholipid/cholesterol/gamma-HCH transport system substrate-binding protein